MRKLLCATALAALLSGPAVAQDGPLGMAYVQAPEAGGGICFDTDARKAMDCAQQKCVADTGLAPEDCIIQGWCLPSRWAADIFVQHTEGPHWHEVQCGWSSREKLEAAVKLLCAEDYFVACTAVQIWDPEGKPQLTEN